MWPFSRKRGKISFYDPEAKAGIISKGEKDYYFQWWVISQGEPIEGAAVAFDSWKPGLAHNLTIDPSWTDYLFPPSADPLDTQYFYSSKNVPAESALSRSAFLRATLSKS